MALVRAAVGSLFVVNVGTNNRPLPPGEPPCTKETNIHVIFSRFPFITINLVLLVRSIFIVLRIGRIVACHIREKSLSNMLTRFSVNN